MNRFAVVGLVVATSILSAACDRTPDTTADEARQEPVVVYAAFEDDTHLRDLVETYTNESGVLVIVRRGNPDDIVDDLIENRVSPPADILMTQSVTHVWRAAEEGALRPLYSGSIRERTPAWSRDPDDLWFGTSYQTAVIVHDMAEIVAAGVPDFATLAQPHFESDLCLSSSSNAVNRTVITMMIDAMGVRPAELAVRGWMRNLAMPVFDTEEQLIAAIHSGSCHIGIVSSTAIAMAMTANEQLDVEVLTPAPAYADVKGIGVARHARNPDGAAALAEWMFTTDAQEANSLQNLTYPANSSARYAEILDVAGPENVSSKNVGLIAWYELEAAKLAERARYRE